MKALPEPVLKRIFLPTVCAAAIGLFAPANADVVRDCDDRIGVEVIAEPWEEMSRSFANNAVRLAVLDYEEPASSSLILMVLYWKSSSDGIPEGRICKFITAGNRFPDGWADIRFAEMSSDYDPDKGLVLSVPVLPYDAVGHTGADEAAKYNVTIAINRATGDVTLIE